MAIRPLSTDVQPPGGERDDAQACKDVQACNGSKARDRAVVVESLAESRDAQGAASFYCRSLPDHLVSFTGKEGRAIFREALDGGTAENFFSLVGNFTSQSETSYCGLGSLAMVLNALQVDPGRTWRGVWRWYSEEMLECCTPLDLVKQRGLTFDQFAMLSRCHSLRPLARRHDQRCVAPPADRQTDRLSTLPA